VLRRMAALAAEVWDAAPKDPLVPAGPNPCAFHDALDTVSVWRIYFPLLTSLGPTRRYFPSNRQQLEESKSCTCQRIDLNYSYVNSDFSQL
jgi:hypothetical protein